MGSVKFLVKFPVAGGKWKTAEEGTLAVVSNGFVAELSKDGFKYLNEDDVRLWENVLTHLVYVKSFVELVPFPVELPTGIGAVIDRGNYTGERTAYFPYVRLALESFRGQTDGVWYDCEGDCFFEGIEVDKEFIESLLKNGAVVVNEGYVSNNE